MSNSPISPIDMRIFECSHAGCGALFPSEYDRERHVRIAHQKNATVTYPDAASISNLHQHTKECYGADDTTVVMNVDTCGNDDCGNVSDELAPVMQQVIMNVGSSIAPPTADEGRPITSDNRLLSWFYSHLKWNHYVADWCSTGATMQDLVDLMKPVDTGDAILQYVIKAVRL
ncbi:hypothetical protein BDB00DRAFT_792604 [Zychaea mexicana]|uniref:uncharacterized protein n=1 Tax=Zychaea mexicana TaxID=64656 RepID=UPI0022FEB86A|nr:uncharacterized protein BDB00DRAFT_792604 [Zychaea mexicana]KAI9484784.1 hypothetical protein BDB00DRAFT_792604 [Zychaea mexicana]